MSPQPVLRATGTLCPLCRHLRLKSHPYNRALRPLYQAYPSSISVSTRQFSNATVLLKKKDKGKPEAREATKDLTATNDPFKLEELEEELNKALEKLKENLGHLRPGGRFNPRVVENLVVQVGSDGKKTTVQSLAQVIPRGRVLQIVADSKETIHAVSREILRSNLSMTPQPDPKNPMQINVPIPPPTTEARAQVVKEAENLGQNAGVALRNVRGAHQKKLRALEKDKSVRPDDLRKAQEKMDKKLKDAQERLKTIMKDAKKQLEVPNAL